MAGKKKKTTLIIKGKGNVERIRKIAPYLTKKYGVTLYFTKENAEHENK